MTIPNVEHFLDQADRLSSGERRSGAPRQVDLRRAISSTYYGIFHTVLTSAADHFVGVMRRTTSEYALAYRSINHRWLRDLCTEVQKPALPAKYKAYEPTSGFSSDLKAFATAVIELQEKRHAADYDPLLHLRRSDVLLAISTARSALQRFVGTPADHRAAFSALLLFRPR